MKMMLMKQHNAFHFLKCFLFLNYVFKVKCCKLKAIASGVLFQYLSLQRRKSYTGLEPSLLPDRCSFSNIWNKKGWKIIQQFYSNKLKCSDSVYSFASHFVYIRDIHDVSIQIFFCNSSALWALFKLNIACFIK